MQTHDDDEHRRSEFLSQLQARADRMRERGESRITAGDEPLEQWEYEGIHCRQLPDDAQGILRVSIGGGALGVEMDYCVHRGERSACISLLRRALAALEENQ